MTRHLFTLALLLVTGASPGWAQRPGRPPVYEQPRVELAPFFGYLFSGSVGTREGSFDVANGINYGFTIDLTVTDIMQLEFLYHRHETEMRWWDRRYGVRETLFDMTADSYHVGLCYLAVPGRITAFGSFTAGATRFDPDDARRDTLWKFSLAVGGGVKTVGANGLGFRGQARMLLPYLTSGGGVWCGVPGGCYANLGGEVMPQLDLTGGVIVAF